MRILDFFKKMFCRHKYEQVAIWQLNGRIDVLYRCTECGKEYFDVIRY